ncbi:transposase [Thiohalorhabdus sp. Cl-TMA]|uniref:Transposase n=1 Tax=Thiohalorhabdus methylotrophus TaxID=3242694 RepID=A0ABV4TZ67_9GAMM
MVETTYEPGMSVSYVARLNGAAPNLLFKWRKLYREVALASVKTGDEGQASQVTQLEKQIRGPQRMLGKKTQEAEILKEALEVAQRKKLLSRSPWPPEGDSRWLACVAFWALRDPMSSGGGISPLRGKTAVGGAMARMRRCSPIFGLSLIIAQPTAIGGFRPW